MIFNPSKYECLRITNKIYPLVSHYSMDGQFITEVSSVKYHRSDPIVVKAHKLHYCCNQSKLYQSISPTKSLNLPTLQ